MKEKTYLEIRDLLKGCKSQNPSVQARFISEKEYPLVWAITEDWLKIGMNTWGLTYDSLVKRHTHGRWTGPTVPQTRILKRMRDKGHTIAILGGFYRWLEESDGILFKNTIRIMLEKGWIQFIETDRPGISKELTITQAGLDALSTAEIEHGPIGYDTMEGR